MTLGTGMHATIVCDLVDLQPWSKIKLLSRWHCVVVTRTQNMSPNVE